VVLSLAGSVIFRHFGPMGVAALMTFEKPTIPYPGKRGDAEGGSVMLSSIPTWEQNQKRALK